MTLIPHDLFSPFASVIVSESLISTVSTQQAGHIRHEPKHTSPAATTHLVTFQPSLSGQNTFRSAIQQISHATASLPSATINALWAAELFDTYPAAVLAMPHMLCGRTVQIPSDQQRASRLLFSDPAVLVRASEHRVVSRMNLVSIPLLSCLTLCFHPLITLSTDRDAPI